MRFRAIQFAIQRPSSPMSLDQCSFQVRVGSLCASLRRECLGSRALGAPARRGAERLSSFSFSLAVRGVKPKLSIGTQKEL